MRMLRIIGRIALLALLPSCDCNCPHFILSTDAPNPFLVDAYFSRDGRHIVLEFNKNIDRHSLIPGRTLIIDSPDQINYDSALIFREDRLVLIPICDIDCQEEDCAVTLTLVSEGQDTLSVQSMEGQALDGDRDGTDGGDFQTSFILAPCPCEPPHITSAAGIKEGEGFVDILEDGDLFFRVIFDREIDSTSVRLDTTMTVVLVDRNYANEVTYPINGMLTWINGRTMYFRGSPEGFCADPTSCVIRVTLIGTDAGAGAITTPGGCALDGDRNSKEGGDFTTFLDIFFDYTPCYPPTIVSPSITNFDRNCSEQFTTGQMGELGIDLTFSEAIDQTSLIPNASVFVDLIANGGPVRVAGSIEKLDDSDRNFRFISDLPLDHLCTAMEFCSFRVIISGESAPDEGIEPVISLDGCRFDGDEDGEEGGNFSLLICTR